MARRSVPLDDLVMRFRKHVRQLMTRLGVYAPQVKLSIRVSCEECEWGATIEESGDGPDEWGCECEESDPDYSMYHE